MTDFTETRSMLKKLAKSVKHLALALVGALLLAGCDTIEEQTARVNAKLPHGCQMQDFGKFGGIDHLVIVICDGRTASINYTESHQSGKFRVTEQRTILQIGTPRTFGLVERDKRTDGPQ